RDGARVVRTDPLESRRHRGHLVAVAHPDVEESLAALVRAVLDAFEEPRVPAKAHLRVAELAHLAGLDRTAELCRHRLHAVTDAEHGKAELDGRLRRTRHFLPSPLCRADRGA